MKRRHTDAVRGFSLVELLVVIAIIGILVAVLIPALSTAQTSAKKAAVKAQISSMGVAIETYRGESALGGSYPPSQTDNRTGDLDHRKIANPLVVQANDPDTIVAGAHLLVHALLGADMLGPPGFFDLDRDGSWADDTHAGPGGAYELDTRTGQALRPRYGGSGTGFGGDELIEKASTLRQLFERGSIVRYDDLDENTTGEQSLFVDAFDMPVLYYRANPSATLIAGTQTNPPVPGYYTQEDNGIITGSDGPGAPYDNDGIDFGPGVLLRNGNPAGLHGLTETRYPLALPSQSDLDDAVFQWTFERFIWDRTVKRRNTPVMRDKYLLIAAGPDRRYGTDDDITNFTRK